MQKEMSWRAICFVVASLSSTPAAISNPITMRGIHAGQSGSEVIKVLRELGVYFVIEASSAGCDRPRKILVFQGDVDRDDAERAIANEEGRTFRPGNAFEIGCAIGKFTVRELLQANLTYHLSTLTFVDGEVARQHYQCRYFKACSMNLDELSRAFQEEYGMQLRPSKFRWHGKVKEGYSGRTTYREEVFIFQDFVGNNEIYVNSGESTFITGEPVHPNFR